MRSFETWWIIDYHHLTERQVIRRVIVIKNKLAQLWAKSGDVSDYYRQVLTELRVKVLEVLES